MTVVVDASVVAAALLDDGPDGRASVDVLSAGGLYAPQLLPFEVANVIRRTTLRGAVDASSGALAIADLGRLAVELVPFEALTGRIWELRENLTAYDAAYVASAEVLEATLFTLDERLTRASGPRCTIAVPTA